MALIGEQFEDSDDICGVVASVRARQDKVALWTKTASNEAAQVWYCVSNSSVCIIVRSILTHVFFSFSSS